MIKAKAKAMIKALPPLPLRSLVAVTKSSQDLSRFVQDFVQELSKICARFCQMYWFASYWGLGHPLHPRGKISAVPKWSRARIPAWLRPGPCQCPQLFLDFATFSAGFWDVQRLL